MSPGRAACWASRQITRRSASDLHHCAGRSDAYRRCRGCSPTPHLFPTFQRFTTCRMAVELISVGSELHCVTNSTKNTHCVCLRDAGCTALASEEAAPSQVDVRRQIQADVSRLHRLPLHRAAGAAQEGQGCRNGSALTGTRRLRGQRLQTLGGVVWAH